MNKLVDYTTSDDYYTGYLKSINGVLKLSPREIDVLAEFMYIDANYKKKEKIKNIANRHCRRRITDKLQMSSENISRYVKTLTEKGMLIAGPAVDALRVNEHLMPKVVGDRIQIMLIVKIK